MRRVGNSILLNEFQTLGICEVVRNIVRGRKGKKGERERQGRKGKRKGEGERQKNRGRERETKTRIVREEFHL